MKKKLAYVLYEGNRFVEVKIMQEGGIFRFQGVMSLEYGNKAVDESFSFRGVTVKDSNDFQLAARVLRKLEQNNVYKLDNLKEWLDSKGIKELVFDNEIDEYIVK